MGAPESGMEAVESPTAEGLLTAFRTIKDGERQRHERVLDYWLSIRGDKEFPPLHDLDPLEISDAGPSSVLLELIGGGQDAEIRHLGESLNEDGSIQRIIDAANPSILHCIAKKLPIVAISRDFLSFEDSFGTAPGATRCWVTLLPLSSCGSWVDYVYAFVSVETGSGKAAKAPESDAEPEAAAAEELILEEAEPDVEVPAMEQVAVEQTAAEETVGFDPAEVTDEPEPVEVAHNPEAEPEPQPVGVVSELEPEPEPICELEPDPKPEAEPAAELDEPSAAKSGPGFSKLLGGFASLTGFYGQGVQVDPVIDTNAPAGEPPVEEPPVEEPDAIEQRIVPPEHEPAIAEPVTTEGPVATEEPVAIEESAAVERPIEQTDEEVAPPAAPVTEEALQSKLSDVRAKADEARQAQLRATVALQEGLSAAYDFALDAETSPEEYLRLVEAQGLKIQLRAPMAPIARLAFDGVCEAATIAQFEAVLAWALKQEIPRGSLLKRIEQAGGISELLSEVSGPA
ncbi:MAG: hypothetical protein ACJ8E6_09900 [Sphingomicrobium sp.]